MKDVTEPPMRKELVAAFAEVVEAELGLSFPASRSGALEEGIREACALAGVADPEALLERASSHDSASLLALADALTVGETYFFRDPQHFAMLRRILETHEGPLRLWSAGCASGAEPYTMAIVALELFGDEARERVDVVGTDLSPQALSQAEAALYRPWALRGLDAETRARWFTPVGKEYQLIDEVRSLVRFSRTNLLESDDAHPSDVDVAFCRNVLVYFASEGIARAATTLRSSLRPDGLLITGPSDPLLTEHGLVIDASGGFIAYRPQEAEPVLAAPLLEPRPAPLPSPAAPAPLPGPPPPEAELPPAELAPASVLEQARALADRGDSASALALIEDTLGEEPLNAEAYLLRAVLRQALGQHQEVLEDTRRALLLDRQLVFAHLVAAPSAAVLGEEEAVRRALRNARATLARNAPEAPVVGADASAAELLAACAQLERTLLGRHHG